MEFCATQLKTQFQMPVSNKEISAMIALLSCDGWLRILLLMYCVVVVWQTTKQKRFGLILEIILTKIRLENWSVGKMVLQRNEITPQCERN